MSNGLDRRVWIYSALLGVGHAAGTILAQYHEAVRMVANVAHLAVARILLLRLYHRLPTEDFLGSDLELPLWLHQHHLMQAVPQERELAV